jgi:hypothetical protein
LINPAEVITIPLILALIAALTWIAIRLYRCGFLSCGRRPSLRRMVEILFERE